jgi:uncharacterized integral membrane protein
MQITFIISLVFAIIVALFALLNANVVTINLLFRQFELSQAIVILVSSVFGALIVFLLDSVKKVKKNMQMKELKKQMTAVEKEKEALVLQLEAEKQRRELLEKERDQNKLQNTETKEEPTVSEEGEQTGRV